MRCWQYADASLGAGGLIFESLAQPIRHFLNRAPQGKEVCGTTRFSVSSRQLAFTGPTQSTKANRKRLNRWELLDIISGNNFKVIYNLAHQIAADNAPLWSFEETDLTYNLLPLMKIGEF